MLDYYVYQLLLDSSILKSYFLIAASNYVIVENILMTIDVDLITKKIFLTLFSHKSILQTPGPYTLEHFSSVSYKEILVLLPYMLVGVRMNGKWLAAYYDFNIPYLMHPSDRICCVLLIGR